MTTVRKGRTFAATAIILAFSLGFLAQQGHLQTNAGGGTSERTAAIIPDLLKRGDVPGLSIAVVRNGQLAWTRSFGVRNSSTREPVTEDTVFEAASLTKPLFAYAVLKLVDEGKLDLDTPLNKYLLGSYDVVDDRRISKITARQVLSHTSGFPNWRARNSKTLPIYFEPGERFSYSGEGFVYLSRVVAKITGMPFQAYVESSVLKPLGMTNSSLSWQEGYSKQKTFSHDLLGAPSGQGEGAQPNAAASLHTTSADYAKFVIAVLDGTGVKKPTRMMMLTPQVRVDEACRNCVGRPLGSLSKDIAWGLGVGLQTTDEGISFWHWGDNGDSKAFFAAFDKEKDAVIVFTNGANGLMLMKDIFAAALPHKYPALSWIETGSLDAPDRVLLRSIVDNGAEKALSEYRKRRADSPEKKLAEPAMNSLGYYLLRTGKIDEAVAVFKLNTDDFPKSANAWDSLAESYMTIGEKKLAIENYKRSIELNPNNKGAIENLKKLEQQ